MTPIAFSRRTTSVLALPILGLSLAACTPEAPGANNINGASSRIAGGKASTMSDAQFDTLPMDTQYKVVNKLLSTLYNGMPVDEFYDIASGTATDKRRDPDFTLSDIRDALNDPLTSQDKSALDTIITGSEAQNTEEEIEPRFRFDRNRPKQMPLARMFQYPLSRDSYSQWMAWHLANTILFSPAEEIDSADITDVQNLFRRLDLAIMSGTRIRDMIAVHQRSVQNWRRFRSPEDNTREMIEIYLGLFDKDDDVPRASQACQDLYLTDESDGYKLAYSDYPNSDPVLVLNQYVTNCNDFYDLIAGHPLLIPRVTSVLVDYFLAGASVEQRLQMTQAISASNPQTFDDIFTAILFSSTYLLDTEREKSFEEAYMGTAKRLRWDAHPDVFRGMTSGNGAIGRANMNEMGWSTMSFKLGRVTRVPMDSLSFGNYHKAIRETLLLDQNRWRISLGLEAPRAPSPEPVKPIAVDASARDRAAYEADVQAYQEQVNALQGDERRQYAQDLEAYEEKAAHYKLIDDMNTEQLIDYLFLTVIQRRATVLERNELSDVFSAEGYLDPEFNNMFARSGKQDDIACITFDYLSRLPEAYYLPSLR